MIVDDVLAHLIIEAEHPDALLGESMPRYAAVQKFNGELSKRDEFATYVRLLMT